MPAKSAQARSTQSLRIKRAYEEPAESDGYRVLVERLWPRGLRRADAKIDAWLKDLAPSTELRRWYGHEIARWPEFKRRYQSELRRSSNAMDELLTHARQGPTTLIYAARDEEHNSATVLRDVVANRLRREP